MRAAAVRVVLVGWLVLAGQAIFATAQPGTPAVLVAPGAYGLHETCATRQGGFAATRWWCVEFVVVRPTGQMEFHCSWSPTASDLLDRWAREAGRTLYLVDENDRRYDHIDTTGAARFGAPRSRGFGSGRLRGTFVFPAPSTATPVFTFRTDDANIAISQIRLESTRLMTTNRREAVLDPLKRAERVEIRDSWAGLGRPHSSHYVLRRVADRIEGAAAVPVRVFENFIQVLLTTPFVPGQYEPALMHTDDYPSISIEIHAGTETVTFSTQSQGAGHIPWAVRVRGETFVAHSDAPARAFALLRPHLSGGTSPSSSARPAPPAAGTDLGVDLRVAAQRGDLAEVTRLLARSANVNTPTPYDQETPLSVAVRGGQADIVRALLAAGADPFVVTPTGSALSVAAASGRNDVLEPLLDAAGRVDAARARDLGEPMIAAIAAGHTETVRVLVRAGANPRKADAVVFAASQGFTEIVRLLVAAGASVDVVDAHGDTPLTAAAPNGQIATVRALLDLGVPAASRSVALGRAARNGQTDIVSLLIAAGADVNHAADKNPPPLLGTFAVDTAQVLLAAGAHPNYRAPTGERPLTAALARSWGGGRMYRGTRRREGSPENVAGTIRLLLDAGASVNVVDSRGRPPLVQAASRLFGQPDVESMRLLLAAGAQVDARDREGRTPLWYAAASNAHGTQVARRREAVALLLAAGADPRLADRNGETPLTSVRAKRARDPALGEIQELLENALNR
jgi:ankyrin repeat protein